MCISVAHNGAIFQSLAGRGSHYGYRYASYNLKLKDDISEYLEQGGKYKFDEKFIYFDNNEDAVLFKLKWL